MANWEHHKVESRNSRQKHITGRFFPQGAGAVVNASNKGRGFTVARTGVGVFLVTLGDAYVDYLDGGATPKDVATPVMHCRITAVNLDANGRVATIQITNYTAANPGVASDIAANAASWISFDFLFNDTVNPST